MCCRLSVCHNHIITWWCGGRLTQHWLTKEACTAVLAVFNFLCAGFGYIMVTVENIYDANYTICT